MQSSWRCCLLVGLLLMVVLSPSLVAEPPQTPEAVGHFGALGFGADEGWEGTSAAYGGTLTIPLSRRWAVEADVTTGQLENFDSQGLGRRTRRVIVAGHIQYRRGSERVYWFAGAGPGLEYRSTSGRHLIQQPSDPFPVVQESESTSNNFAPIGYKTGVVVLPVPRLLIRGEVLMQHHRILPNAMIRIGVGWRF